MDPIIVDSPNITMSSVDDFIRGMDAYRASPDSMTFAAFADAMNRESLPRGISWDVATSEAPQGSEGRNGWGAVRREVLDGALEVMRHMQSGEKMKLILDYGAYMCVHICAYMADGLQYPKCATIRPGVAATRHLMGRGDQ